MLPCRQTDIDMSTIVMCMEAAHQFCACPASSNTIREAPPNTDLADLNAENCTRWDVVCCLLILRNAYAVLLRMPCEEVLPLIRPCVIRQSL
jgi:hypothetical protein